MSPPRLLSVLLLDDDPIYLLLARRYLELHDDVQVVGLARSEQEAIALMADESPDVLLVGVGLSEPAGGPSIAALRQAEPGIWIVALGLVDSDESRQISLQAGANEYVPKDSIHTRLLAALNHPRSPEPVFGQTLSPRMAERNRNQGKSTRPN